MKRTVNDVGYAAIILVSFAADQLIKAAIRRVPLSSVVFRMDGFLEITHCTNTGAAFSIFQGSPRWIAVLSGGLMLIAAMYLIRNLRLHPRAAAALSLLLGGGLGNLYDRIVYGGVTDYIRLLFVSFPVFNLADICITLSVAVLSYYLLMGRLDACPDGKKNGSNH